MSDETSIDPEAAVRLARDYQAAATASLPMQDGRDYANLVAAYCLMYPKAPETPVLLTKAIKRAPGMALLVASHIADALPEGSKPLKFVYEPFNRASPTLEECSDFVDIVTLISVDRNSTRT